MEVQAGFEPAYNGFADRRVNQLHHCTLVSTNIANIIDNNNNLLAKYTFYRYNHQTNYFPS